MSNVQRLWPGTDFGLSDLDFGLRPWLPPCSLKPHRDKSDFPRHQPGPNSRKVMKHLVSKLLVVVYLLPTLSLAQGTDPDIKRVEQGLLPQVLLKGDPGWSIAERMKFYKVPGLSVAVIKDFKIDWARA